MSIQTELTRIINARAAIKTAVEGKGVTVPDGTLLDGMASLIESIQAGGGGEVAYGTITPADMTAAQLEIEHGLGVVPGFVMICAADNTNKVYSRSTPYGQSFVYALYLSTSNGYHRYGTRYLTSSSVNFGIGNINNAQTIGVLRLSETSIIWDNKNTSYGFGKSPAPFLWIAIKEIAT